MKKTGVNIGVFFSIFFGAALLFSHFNESSPIQLGKWLDILVRPVQLVILLIFGGGDRNFGVFFIFSFLYLLALGFFLGYSLYLIGWKLKGKWKSRPSS